MVKLAEKEEEKKQDDKKADEDQNEADIADLVDIKMGTNVKTCDEELAKIA